MERKFRKIGVLTSGGDAPGMNAAVRAVARAALARGVEVMGIYGGYSGLINDRMIELKARTVSNIIGRGGTILYSDRCLEFKTEEGMQKAIAVCRAHEIDGIVAIGGDGTFRGATDLSVRGIPTIGLPGTIDNDITATENSIGFDTAMNIVLQLGDRLRDTCESHARCEVMEVMGRGAGDIALNTAMALGAVAVAIPEVPFDEAACIEKIRRLREDGKRSFMVVVSEGVQNFAEGLAKRIQEQTGVETKFVRPAHIVRGGDPTLGDRVLATKMGEYAVDRLLAGESNLVICQQNSQIVAVDILYSQCLDRMYKGTLKEGMLDKFSAEQIAEMEKTIAEKKEEFRRLYAMVNDLAR
ncbi:MAG: ATP-dependent 6-phosphofructokinase [Eubacteriales bacterium]